MSQFIHELESRTLLSTSAASVASPVILADRAAIVVDVKRLVADRTAVRQLIVTAKLDFLSTTKVADVIRTIGDLRTLRNDVVAHAPAATIAADKAALAADKVTLRLDFANLITQVKSLLLNGKGTLKADVVQLRTDVLKLVADRRAGL